MINLVEKEWQEHQKIVQESEILKGQIAKIGELLCECLKKNGKILICGNGGSAADAQHFAAELSGRYKKERKALAGIALTTDTSALSAIGNDYGFEFVFSRQVEALKKAKELNMLCLGLSGKGGGMMNKLCDYNLVVPSDDTARIQEMHILIIHALCQIVDESYKTDL
ncbi:TPA: D-sedoheptulose 7-phosphate isomerase [Campylobacter jejuni]|nr:D-sedoheptulose 7-phosphate isomerase [Campylobacter jejuni]MGG42269.1 SIS domain-containing protein [Campylobacter jejuni]HDZ4329809.1 D-sedoheptulose 7-phosphate isomerase [Campylobacter jejuni]HEC1716945.1 D-sedoheptulose 7-phosphate isomerase [Campylobacter jejuni]HED4594248.1 D-sedoheptulose 7-phosphate isomerase [Campylobacter jejuni]